MRDAMEPVKAEVDAEQQADGRHPFRRSTRRVGNFRAGGNARTSTSIAGEQQHVQEDRQDLIDDAATQIGDRIVEAVQPLAMLDPGSDLDADQQKEKWHGIDDIGNAAAQRLVDEIHV